MSDRLPADQPSNPSRWIGFRLGSSRLLVPASVVSEVMRSPAVTPVPGAKAWLLGLACTGDRVLVAVDLKRFLGAPAARAQVIRPLLAVDDAGSLVGFVVDEVFGPRRIQTDIRVGPPAAMHGWLDGWVRAHYRAEDGEWGIFELPAVLRDDGFLRAAA